MTFSKFLDEDTGNVLETVANTNFESEENTSFNSNRLPSCLRTPKSSSKLKIIHLNVQRGLDSKKDLIEVFLDEETPDIFCVTEHGLIEESIVNLHIENYTLKSYFCRNNIKWGGVAIFVRDDSLFGFLETSRVNDSSLETTFEIAELRLLVDNRVTICSVIYRSPDDSNFDAFLDKLEEYLIKTVSGNRLVMLTGDFNIDKAKNPSKFQVLTDLLNVFDLKIKIDLPTRISEKSASCLDNFLTNITDAECSVLEPLISDHKAIMFEMIANKKVKSEELIEMRCFSESNLTELRIRLGWEKWSHYYDINSVDEIYEQFITTICYYMDVACPMRKLKIRTNQKKLAWITDEIIAMKSQVQNSYANWTLTKCDRKKEDYVRLKKNYRDKITKAKSEHFLKEIKNSDNPCKSSWKIINNSRKNKKTFENNNISLFEDGTLKEDPETVCNIFNTYFNGEAQNLIGLVGPVQVEPTEQIGHAKLDCFEPLTLKELNKIISSIKNKTSTGHDGISNKIIKLCIKEIEQPLLHLINTSLRQGIFPEGGKLAIIKPLHKKDCKNLPQNYRPISLLSSISKILEKAVCCRLMRYLEDNNLIFPKQFGYQKNKSTKLALIDFVNKCIDALESGEMAIGCFIDLSKAFDCVNHSILINKLVQLGVGERALSWLNSYLLNRKHQTMVNATLTSGERKHYLSQVAHVKMGVPQGSILGPILFLIYINNVSRFVPEESLTIFADDTSLFVKNKNLSCLENQTFVQLNALSQYFVDINLKINPNKSNYMFITTRQKRQNLMRAGTQTPSVLLDNEFLQESTFVDYLGVRLDEDLSWNDHVDKLAFTLSSNTFLLRNFAAFNNMALSKLIYFSLIESYIRYSIVLWGSSSKSNLKRIFTIQKRAIRYMTKLKHMETHKHKFLELQILTVPSLYMYEVILFVKEHNLIQSHQHSYSTRNREINPSLQHSSKIFETKPSYIGVKYFTQLPQELKEIKDVVKFKNKLKSYLLEKCFYDLPELS